MLRLLVKKYSARQPAILGRRTLVTHQSSSLATITELLNTIGSGDDSHIEVERFLARFSPKSTGDTPPLAVVKVGGEVALPGEIDVFARGLAFLYNVGLFPIVVHGGGPQMNADMARRGVEPNYVGGLRVTDAETLAVARKTFLEVCNCNCIYVYFFANHTLTHICCA